MRILIISLLAFTAVNVTGCRTAVETENYKVEVEDNDRGNGDFCPPGQAKKGNC